MLFKPRRLFHPTIIEGCSAEDGKRHQEKAKKRDEERAPKTKQEKLLVPHRLKPVFEHWVVS